MIITYEYKPERVLYYMPIAEGEKEEFYAGNMPEKLLKYDGAFGTYDCPGLFILRDGDKRKEVFGIEYRAGDDRVKYPEGLDTIVLGKGFTCSALFTDDSIVDESTISESISLIKEGMGRKMYKKAIVPKEDPDVIQVFTLHNKCRVYIDAMPITEEEYRLKITPLTENEKLLYTEAYHDFITGYYNWNYLNPIIGGYGFKGIQDFAFCHFDVKDFNAINVIYGHDAANVVLANITKKMEASDWVYFSCRCHNDNFAMMIKDMPEEETRDKLYKLFESMSVLEADKHYHICFRCGVVPMRNALLLGDRVADGAKLAQRMGTKLNETEVLFYTDVMHDENVWAKKIKAYLGTAIENDEFLVYLQPKYDISTERIRGAEALIRWNYQGKQLISPFRFIPIFEKDGSISKIDDIVLIKVCQCLKKWKEEGLPLYPISVNLSRKRLENPNLIDHLVSIVDSYSVDHTFIDFELTESAAYDNQEYMISVMRKLKELGFKISMDDFGTGYSSLSLLTTMPFDTLKIDKSFVDGITGDETSQKECAVIKHIISMANALNLHCLAEGAEDKIQVDKLREFGCEMVQGYYYSKPVPVDEYERQLRL